MPQNQAPSGTEVHIVSLRPTHKQKRRALAPGAPFSAGINGYG